MTYFLAQEYHDHIDFEVSSDSQHQRKTLDFQLCALLWQFVEPNIWGNLRTSKTNKPFRRKVWNIFANDNQHLYDSAEKLASFQQFDHDKSL